jgi:hypothetical protein
VVFFQVTPPSRLKQALTIWSWTEFALAAIRLRRVNRCPILGINRESEATILDCRSIGHLHRHRFPTGSGIGAREEGRSIILSRETLFFFQQNYYECVEGAAG